MSRRYLSVPDVVERYGGTLSIWSVYEGARNCTLPHRKRPGTKTLLFIEEELDAFDDGAELEVQRLPRGGRVVKPILPTNPGVRVSDRNKERAAASTATR